MANGKRQTVDCCVSQKRENLHFLTFLTLLRSYSIYLVNRQEKSLIKSSFSVFWQKGNFILPFAINVILNLSIMFSTSECLNLNEPAKNVRLVPHTLHQSTLILYRKGSLINFLNPTAV